MNNKNLFTGIISIVGVGSAIMSWMLRRNVEKTLEERSKQLEKSFDQCDELYKMYKRLDDDYERDITTLGSALKLSLEGDINDELKEELLEIVKEYI